MILYPGPYIYIYIYACMYSICSSCFLHMFFTIQAVLGFTSSWQCIPATNIVGYNLMSTDNDINIIQHNSTSFNIIVYWNIIENTGGRIVINPWIYSCLFRLFFLASHFSCSWHGCNSNDNLQEMNAVSEGNKPFVRQSKWLKHTMWAFQV